MIANNVIETTKNDLTRISRRSRAAGRDKFKLLFLLLAFARTSLNFYRKKAISPARNCPISSKLVPSIAISTNLSPARSSEFESRRRRRRRRLPRLKRRRNACERKRSFPGVSSNENSFASPRNDPVFHAAGI